LEEHRDWEKISLKNTAMAARKVKEDGDPAQAAIAGKTNADIYGLQVLNSAIQDNKNNSTRFIIVTGRKIYRKKAEKMSICFEIPHESGSLYRMLSHFIYNSLNMTNIQSRPIGGKNWEYRFFVDFEGTFEDTAVQNAMRGLKEETTYLKILGTY
jgi:chorismate mutase/prephenate dehydratase